MSWVSRRLSVSMYSPYSRTFSGLVDAPEPQELAEDADRGERRAQLVRDVGDEVALHLRQLHLARGGAQGERDAAEQHGGEQRPRAPMLTRKLRRAHCAGVACRLVSPISSR